MKDLRDYKIPFVGLKLGTHHFNFEPDDRFFTHFASSQVTKGRVFADLALDKKDRLLVLNFDISGSIQTECDRCGQLFDLPIHGNYTVYAKIGDAREEDKDNEEVVWIGENESVIDVAEMIYEFTHLSIPIKRTHPDRPDGTPGCDPEIMKLLEHSTLKQEHDPRWDILDKLSDN